MLNSSVTDQNLIKFLHNLLDQSSPNFCDIPALSALLMYTFTSQSVE